MSLYHDNLDESRKPHFNFAVTVQRETSKALLFRFYEGACSDMWIPRSQAKYVGKTWGGLVGGERDVYQLPNWLVREKGIYRQRMLDDEFVQ